MDNFIELNSSKHKYYMSLALKEACKAMKYNDIPIGAIIVKDDKIIAKAHNKIQRFNNSTLHAEVIVINSAIKKIKDKSLIDCDLYITLEPCSMCAGAIILSKIKNVYISASDSKAGAGGSVLNILENKSLNHQAKVYYGLLEEESSSLLKDFFQKLRTNGK